MKLSEHELKIVIMAIVLAGAIASFAVHADNFGTLLGCAFFFILINA